MYVVDCYDDLKPNPAAIEPVFYRASGTVITDIECCAIEDKIGCSIEIIRQPQSNRYKFNSPCEGENVMKTCIMGEDSIDEYPTVKLVNFNKKNLDKNLIQMIEVELRTGDGFHVHPYSLIRSSDENQRPSVLKQSTVRKLNPQLIYFRPLDDEECVYKLGGLNIMKTPDHLIIDELEIYYHKLQQWTKRESKQSVETFVDDEFRRFGDLKQARLKIQGVIIDKRTNIIVKYITHAVKTQVIYDAASCLTHRAGCTEIFSHNMQSLRIIRSSKLMGNVKGEEEMMLFVSMCGNKIEEDIEIEFLQLENNLVVWNKVVKPKMVYNNSIIVFDTPAYTKFPQHNEGTIKVNVKTTVDSRQTARIIERKVCGQPVKVFFRLIIKNTKECSQNWLYYYTEYNCTTLINKATNSGTGSAGHQFTNEPETSVGFTGNKVLPSMEDGSTGVKAEKEADEQISGNESEDHRVEQEHDSTDTIDTNSETIKNIIDDRRRKMDALVDRTCDALLEVAKSRSIHKYIKIHRYLLNVQNEDGNTPIHLAILNGHFDLVEIFVDVALTIPNYNIINVKNNLQLTPLLLAAHMEEHELCKFLLESTADLADVDLYGQNCFHIAAKKENIQLTRVLVNFVKLNLNMARLMNSCDYNGETPLHIACKRNAYEIVEELLASNFCYIGKVNNRSGETVLHYTSSLNYLRLTKLLLRFFQSGSLGVDVQSNNGCTPLHVAVANRNYLIVRLLIKANANCYIESFEPIHGYNMIDHKKTMNNTMVHSEVSSNAKIDTRLTVTAGNAGDATLMNQAERVKLMNSKLAGEIEKFSVEVRDIATTSSCVKQSLSNVDKGKIESSKKLPCHCLNAFHYASKDNELLKLLSSCKYVPYLPKSEIDQLLDLEIKNKLKFKLNSSSLIKTVNAETSQVDYLNLIEIHVKKLSADFKMRMGLIIDEREHEATKRKSNDEEDEVNMEVNPPATDEPADSNVKRSKQT